MANRTKLTKEKRAKFLRILVDSGGHVTKAARAVALARGYMYQVRERDPQFAADWDAAIEEGTENLEREAYRRAFKGTRKPVFQGGELVGHIQEYSDTLTIFLLKGRRPTVYRDQAVVEHNLTGALTIDATMAGLSTDALEQIEAILAREAAVATDASQVLP